ncbi:MAG: hypothetical protein K6F50_07960 [Kiritimatiellae bacterium]|nr:hypothetical protein [Kiritimatiellia bacterium]
MKFSGILSAASAVLLSAAAAAPSRTSRHATAANFGPERTSPVQKGEFRVDLVAIAFPDCVQPENAAKVKADLSLVDGGTVESYYKEYSQGITWPALEIYPAVYPAPQPLGYYCRWEQLSNPLGFKSPEEGEKRAAKLREDALKFVKSKGKLSGKATYTCYVYCNKLDSSPALMEKLIRPYYKKPSPDEKARGVQDNLPKYAPQIPWRDPLWPNSRPQVVYPANGRTLVHEIGHCLGSPDYYHASEEHDGVEGTPCLDWDYGPTGLAYCRYIHHAFVPAAAYPKIDKSCEVTLSPRSAKFAEGSDGATPPPLGVFIPSTHPNYLFCVEYCHGEKLPVGHPDAQGLLVHVLNVTMTKPFMGPPDLCYTYRAGDGDHKGRGEGDAYLRPGDSFDAESDPAAVLPNLLPAGIAITDIRENGDGTCTFRLDVDPPKLPKAELDRSLLPQTEIVELSDPLPTSFRAKLNVRYRGEPLLEEYGFCCGTKKEPTEKKGTLFPLFHRDRTDARIIDLKPGATYRVRAYARNKNGIRYSENEKEITLPSAGKTSSSGATLFAESDHLLSNWYFQKWYHGWKNGVINSANPLFAFMALANYYRAMPGEMPAKAKQKKTSGNGPDLARVHSNPSETRPRSRLADTDKLKDAIVKLIDEAGFSQADFIPGEEDGGKAERKKKKKPAVKPAGGKKKDAMGELAPWAKKCAAALKMKTPEKFFFSCRTAEDINALAPEIRRWILMSQPVMVVRESPFFENNTEARWPLDIAFIDGLGDGATSFHVVFPGGKDRGLRPGGVMELGDILDKTTNAMVIFYRPGPPAPASSTIK